jgi:uncharacterized protein
MSSLDEKYARLRSLLEGYGSFLVAFSGGVDSTFLLHAATKVPSARFAAAVLSTPVYTPEEIRSARDFCAKREIPCHLIECDDITPVEDNPSDRCYRCKTDMFGRIAVLAKEKGFDFVLDGTNADDLDDYRPGLKALKEKGVKSPLLEAGLAKDDIRKLSRRAGLKTWDKPSIACLSSRFPFGTRIDRGKLAMVYEAEKLLWALKFRQVRVRWSDGDAKIEVLPSELARLSRPGLRKRVLAEFVRLGFHNVLLDLKGYRTGASAEKFLLGKPGGKV